MTVALLLLLDTRRVRRRTRTEECRHGPGKFPKIPGRRRGMSLSKLWEMVKDREAWRAAVHRVTRVRHN